MSSNGDMAEPSRPAGDVAIRVRGVGKQYSIGRKVEETLREAMVGRLRDPLGRRRIDTFWALQDVNLEVRRGEVVGLIGRNGAGKSTLLKILSRITVPTTGEIDLWGRIGSLLEVGTGFHPELTGRENIYLNGSILGMSRREIDARFDEIVAFSGVERFLDTPVKRFSSGMYVRLAFAVAAHLEPEILIVDEVLAVGDEGFQRKCLGKMQDVAGAGRTVLFVSHNMQAISTLTRRCIFLEDGRVSFDGDTQDAIAQYLKRSEHEEMVYIAEPSPTGPKITRVELRTSRPANTQTHGQAMEVRVTVSTPSAINGCRLSFKVISDKGQPAMYQYRYDSQGPMLREPGMHELVCRIPKCRLYLGNYRLDVVLAERYGGKRIETLEGVCPFKVTMYGLAREGGWFPDQGAYIEDSEWSVQRLGNVAAPSTEGLEVPSA